MNRKIAILLAVLFISVGIRDALTVLYFYGNQQAIADNLCIERNDLENKCQGKCFLYKRLMEEENDESENLPLNRPFEHLELKVLKSKVSFQGIQRDELPKKKSWLVENSLYLSTYISRLFRPPEVIL